MGKKCDMKLFLLFLTTFSFAQFFPQNESSCCSNFARLTDRWNGWMINELVFTYLVDGKRHDQSSWTYKKSHWNYFGLKIYDVQCYIWRFCNSSLLKALFFYVSQHGIQWIFLVKELTNNWKFEVIMNATHVVLCSTEVYELKFQNQKVFF